MEIDYDKIISESEDVANIKKRYLGRSISLISNNKVTSLLNNTEESLFQKSSSRWYSLKLKEPVYVESMELHASGFSSFHKMKVEWEVAYSAALNSNDFNFSKDGMFVCKINNFVSSIRFKPDKKLLGDTPFLQSIKFYGYTTQDFQDICQRIDDLEKYLYDFSQALLKVESQRDSAQSQIEDAKEIQSEHLQELETLRQDIGRVKKELLELNLEEKNLSKDIGELSEKEKTIGAKVVALEDSVDARTKERDQLNTDIAKKKSDLKELDASINLFPTELSGFAKEVKTNTWMYLGLSFLPIFTLLAAAFYLFNDAQVLSTDVVEREFKFTDVLSILLARLPFVLVMLAIIGAAYRLAKFCISEILRMNKQKLNLFKLSIIATDVTRSSLEGLEVNEEFEYERRKKLKMDMLKAHLKEYIGGDTPYIDGEKISEEKPDSKDDSITNY